MMQLTQDEEAELEEARVMDDGRRSLREFLRGLTLLEQGDEGAEARWAVQYWLTRWRHVLGVLQRVTDIVERRLTNRPGCSIPLLRSPQTAAQRIRLLSWAARLANLMLEMGREIISHYTRGMGRLPEHLPLPARPPPRVRRPMELRTMGYRERSSSRDDRLHERRVASSCGEDEEPEEEPQTQTFDILEWQTFLNHGISGADLTELDMFLEDILRRTDQLGAPSQVRAQAMWTLGVMNLAVRRAPRILSIMATVLETREVPGAMILPVDDAQRARLLSLCARPRAILGTIVRQLIQQGLDDALTDPQELPPRLPVRERPPREDPSTMPVGRRPGNHLDLDEVFRDTAEEYGRGVTVHPGLLMPVRDVLSACLVLFLALRDGFLLGRWLNLLHLTVIMKLKVVLVYQAMIPERGELERESELSLSLWSWDTLRLLKVRKMNKKKAVLRWKEVLTVGEMLHLLMPLLMPLQVHLYLQRLL
ncbi:unnamed protein product [Symbiodinium sp. CCMP2456]|nr:unnamed protein product [Symbiodinium sp. CCMP2456]